MLPSCDVEPPHTWASTINKKRIAVVMFGNFSVGQVRDVPISSLTLNLPGFDPLGIFLHLVSSPLPTYTLSSQL